MLNITDPSIHKSCAGLSRREVLRIGALGLGGLTLPDLLRAREEVAALPAEWDRVIVATGPLTSATLAASIAALTGEDALAFFDAIAPIVHRDSIDMDIAWVQSRYDKGEAAYINCPLDAAQYEALIDGLVSAECTEFKEWEKDTPYFEGCLPVEVMAARGRETLRFGPMKPVGLTNPHSPEKPHAVVQLRRLDLGRLLRCQHRLVAPVLRTLQRRQRTEVPHALKVRLPPRRPRRVGLGTGGYGPQQHNPNDHGHSIHSMAHLTPPQ